MEQPSFLDCVEEEPQFQMDGVVSFRQATNFDGYWNSGFMQSQIGDAEHDVEFEVSSINAFVNGAKGELFPHCTRGYGRSHSKSSVPGKFSSTGNFSLKLKNCNTGKI